MWDSEGDGWNKNILGFLLNGEIFTTFGNDFDEGSEFTQTVSLPVGHFYQIVVVQKGPWSSEVGF